MIIGVPKEIKIQEYRVALLPSVAYQLVDPELYMKIVETRHRPTRVRDGR